MFTNLYAFMEQLITNVNAKANALLCFVLMTKNFIKKLCSYKVLCHQNKSSFGHLQNAINGKQVLTKLKQSFCFCTCFAVPCLWETPYKDRLLLFPLGEGFGFNGNILETNVLNLGVVLTIVFVVGGDSLRSTLDERKQSIARNLERAEERAKEAKERLLQAKSQLEAAQKRADDILEQGNLTADQERKDLARKKEEEISRLTKKKEELLYVEEEKAFFQVYENFVDRIIEKTKERLLTRLNAQTHTKVIDSQIHFISKCRQ